MCRNSIRIVCNPATNRLSYYMKNEKGEWDILSGNSPLSRQCYTKISIRKSAKGILMEIDGIYNRKNRGVDIFFEGTKGDYDYLVAVIEKFFSNRNIQCDSKISKIAVLGKIAVGKSTLIEGLEAREGNKYSKIEKKEYIQYTDERNRTAWFEIGIDLGKENVEKALQTVENLAKEGLSTVIYCISATSGRIENIEREFIQKIERQLSGTRVIIALTMCYRDNDRKIIDEIKKVTDQATVISTLAKEYKTGVKDRRGNMIIVEPFGLDQVLKYVFEGR